MMVATKPEVQHSALYNQAQAAKALGVDRHTLARYVKNGYLKVRVRQLDRRTLIPGSEIIKVWSRMLM